MISMIVAYAHNRVIGRSGSMPWHLPDDLKHFRQLTLGQTIVMGRKTYDSIGYALPARRNVVLSSNPGLLLPDVLVVHSKDEVLALGDVFIIGGATLYQQFLDVANRLYITEIDLDVDGDVYFPEWNKQQFRLISTTEMSDTSPHRFLCYER